MGGMPGMGQRRPSGPVKAKAIEHKLNLSLEVEAPALGSVGTYRVRPGRRKGSWVAPGFMRQGRVA